MKGLDYSKDHRSNPRTIEPSEPKFFQKNWIPQAGLFWIVFCLWSLTVWSETVPQIVGMEESIQPVFKVSPVLKAAPGNEPGGGNEEETGQTWFSP